MLNEIEHTQRIKACFHRGGRQLLQLKSGECVHGVMTALTTTSDGGPLRDFVRVAVAPVDAQALDAAPSRLVDLRDIVDVYNLPHPYDWAVKMAAEIEKLLRELHGS